MMYSPMYGVINSILKSIGLEKLAAHWLGNPSLTIHSVVFAYIWFGTGFATVIYSAGIAAEAAHRWKTQINENSKAWAFYEIFPELNHNATVGFQFPPEVVQLIRVVLLRSPLFNERVKLRYEVTCELLERAGVEYEYVDSEGKSPLAQMMSLILMGDLTSYYMAILYGIDPSPVEVINYLKDKLAEG